MSATRGLGETPATGSCAKLHSGYPPRRFVQRFAGSFKRIRSLIFSATPAFGGTIRGSAPLSRERVESLFFRVVTQRKSVPPVHPLTQTKQETALRRHNATFWEVLKEIAA